MSTEPNSSPEAGGVVVACEDVGPCRKKLTIEVPAQAVAAEIGRVVGDYRNQLRLPGFRKGKVPASLVRQRYRDDVEREVAERLVPRYWRQAQAEQNLDPLLPPEFDPPTIEEGEPMTLIASVETRPSIEIGDLDGFDLPAAAIAPTDEEVDEALTDLRRHRAQWRAVERPAARGDRVVAKMSELAAGETDAAGEPKTLRIELGDDGVPEELTLALTGLAAGGSTEYRAEAGEGEAPSYRIEVEEVQEQELPELDDELARGFGDFETLDDLRRAVAEDLERGKRRERTRQRQEALLKQLRERHPVDLPRGVVDRESEQLVQRYAEQLASQGVDVEKAEVDWLGLQNQVRPEAERRVHERLLLDAIAARDSVRLDEHEFERLLASLAAQQGTNALTLRRQLSESGRLEPLRAQLLREQVLRQLIGEDETEGGAAAGEPDGEDAGNEERA